MGNIYNAPTDLANTSTIIDWQSVVISPLYLQARFPEFLPTDDDYVLGLDNTPTLPESYLGLSESEKK